MKRHYATLIFLACLCAADAAVAIDRVRKIDKETIFGDIASITPREVVIVDRANRVTVPVGQIKAVVFDAEPEPLGRARSEITQGRYEDAQRTLGEIDASKITRPMIAADVEFFKAFAAAQLALRGKGEIREAGRQMWRFVTAHPDSYHWFEANRLAGDLLVANRQYAPAVPCYDALAQAPWFAARLAAAVGKGRALLADGRTDLARASFQSALNLSPTSPNEKDPEADRQKKLAQLGVARCLLADGKKDEAEKLVREVIDQSNPEDVALGGEAYNALGAVLRKAGKPYDALLAFLHTDILYFADPQQHAEALANLVELWHEVHKTDRAIQAQETLQARYPNSPWISQ
ncbi:MAG TPA: tetratricopeptide repeat protein [Thermoguttaceae bacterium]|nr:tetratricopeptide repeat protein [Thermoguttaceae bacterium]